VKQINTLKWNSRSSSQSSTTGRQSRIAAVICIQ